MFQSSVLEHQRFDRPFDQRRSDQDMMGLDGPETLCLACTAGCVGAASAR